MIESEKQGALMSTIERRREAEELGDDLVQTKSAEKTH